MSLLAAWNFDEASGDVLDVTGNGHGFAISGSTVRTASGHTNGGLTQSATTTSAGPSAAGLQGTSRTWMTWIKFAAAVNGWILEFHVASANTGAWGLLDISGTLRFRAKDSSNNVYESTSINRNLGNWQHIAATHDGANLKLYINGVLQSTTPMAVAVWTADVVNVLDQTGSNVIIDDVRFYDQALDAATITSLMGTPVVGGTTANPAAETNTAQPVTRARTVPIGTASETDSPQAAARLRTAAIGTAAETDAAMAATRIGTARGIALETDVALPVGRARLTVVGAALEADAAPALATGHTVAVGAATESDGALVVARSRTLQAAPAVETDAVPALTRARVIVVGMANEADTSLPVFNPNAVIRDLDLRAVVEPTRFLVEIEPPRFRTEIDA